MRDTEAGAFNSILDVTWEVYGKQISDQAKRAYWELLKRYSLEDIGQALNKHMTNTKSGQFTPKPADIVKMIDGDSESLSAIAWTKTIQAIKTVGPYRSVVFDDPAIHAAIRDMGGWIQICATTEKEEPFVAKDFERRYSGYAQRDKINYPKRLTGLSDHHNHGQAFKRGKAIPQLTILGDQDRARLVYKGGSDQKQGLKLVTVDIKPPANQKLIGKGVA